LILTRAQQPLDIQRSLRVIKSPLVVNGGGSSEHMLTRGSSRTLLARDPLVQHLPRRGSRWKGEGVHCAGRYLVGVGPAVPHSLVDQPPTPGVGETVGGQVEMWADSAAPYPALSTRR
jgi:hypothetical protein